MPGHDFEQRPVDSACQKVREVIGTVPDLQNPNNRNLAKSWKTFGRRYAHEAAFKEVPVNGMQINPLFFIICWWGFYTFEMFCFAD